MHQSPFRGSVAHLCDRDAGIGVVKAVELHLLSYLADAWRRVWHVALRGGGQKRAARLHISQVGGGLAAACVAGWGPAHAAPRGRTTKVAGSVAQGLACTRHGNLQPCRLRPLDGALRGRRPGRAAARQRCCS